MLSPSIHISGRLPDQVRVSKTPSTTSSLALIPPVRGPCPLLNTLANHGYIPRDGRNMTKDHIVAGLVNSINFEPSLAEILWEEGLVVNPEPNAVSFNLDQLNAHNVLEHDASMSRADAALGNNHVFNEAVFQSSRRHWTAETVTVGMMANTTVQRQAESHVTNGDCYLSTARVNSCIGQAGIPITVFGNIEQATVKRSIIEYWFSKYNKSVIVQVL